MGSKDRSEMTVFWGTVVHATWDVAMVTLRDTLIGVRDGQIEFMEDASNKETLSVQYDFNMDDIEKLSDREFLLPGFVDTHIHASQYVNAGKGLDLSLLEWLETYTFPAEAKFRNPEVAKEMYTRVVRRVMKNGTTTACYFATIHLESTLKLCRVIAAAGQRAYVGKVCMNRNCPLYYTETTPQSLADTKTFVEAVINLKNPLLTPVVTPRFVPTCDEDLLKGLGDIAARYDLPIQSHISENKAEIDWVKKLHPDCGSYTEVYHKHGLLNHKTVMAHAVHLSDDELRVFRETGAGISHCPNSNTSLCSGLCDVRRLLDSGVKVGLGTDVSGGFHPSLLDSIRMATQVSNILSLDRDSYRKLDYKEAFRLATLGGAQVLGLDKTIGNFEVGKDFDALRVRLDSPDTPVDVFSDDTLQDQIQKFIYLGDDRNIIEVYVAGRKVVDKVTPDVTA